MHIVLSTSFYFCPLHLTPPFVHTLLSFLATFSSPVNTQHHSFGGTTGMKQATKNERMLLPSPVCLILSFLWFHQPGSHLPRQELIYRDLKVESTLIISEFYLETATTMIRKRYSKPGSVADLFWADGLQNSKLHMDQLQAFITNTSCWSQSRQAQQLENTFP